MKSGTIRSISRYLLLVLMMLLINGTASAQQIVTNPLLNTVLSEFQKNFLPFIQSHPELMSGAALPIDLKGSKGKVSFTFHQEGQYQILYDNLLFTATSPISADRFNVMLKLRSITLSGNGELTIMVDNESFTLDCPNSQFQTGPITFSAEITANLSNGVSVANPQISFDPDQITLSLPCLDDAISGAAEAKQPKPGVLKKVRSALHRSAVQRDSSVLKTILSATMSSSMVVSVSTAIPCSSEVSADVRAVIADLANISQQAQDNGFQTALQKFLNDLKFTLPFLGGTTRGFVQQFINDFNAAIADGQLNTAEQMTLTTDLSNIVMSTGISSSQLDIITTGLAAIVGNISGVSTAQLKTDLQKLANDVRGCLGK